MMWLILLVMTPHNDYYKNTEQKVESIDITFTVVNVVLFS